ncbi:MAG: aminopeptidase [Labilithrix sp.]|nr:aminopeptidase [Labilithrix sp.]MCW5813911.1 aminopeptidase [Labilithrix sp.]
MARSLVLLLAFVLGGCLPVRYITQAAAGQDQLNSAGIEIAEIVEGEHLDKRTRELLAHVARIKAFGERYGLKRTKNYERYIDIRRPAVVWVVSACHPLAFRPQVWKFPIVGSITYTGWFDKKEAQAYGAELARRGWDVDVRPSPAYSTLGWFDDPILSTMISSEEDALGELADTVLHETLHATFYVPSQSTLNESVASFFGDELAAKYLDEAVGPDSVEKKAFLEHRARSAERGALMKQAYDELAKLYADRKRPKEERLAEKKRIIAELKAKTKSRRAINNASLIQMKTYGSGKPQLRELLQQCGGDYPRMLRTLDRLRATSKTAPPHSDPGVLLQPLLAEGGCP